MFTKLRLQNFQIHKEPVTLDLAKIVSLVGESDSGKSSILRAIRMICLDEWDKSFISHGEENAIVMLMADGKTIRKEKGKKNVLKLDGQLLTAFGAKSPEHVQKLLNVSELNFQRQFDPHFWFAETAGKVSKELNKIVNLEVIDKIIARVAGDIRKTKSEVDIIRDRVKEAEQEIKSLSWVPQFIKDVDRLEAMETALTAKRQEAAKLTVLLKTANQARSTQATAKELEASGLLAVSAGEALQRHRQRSNRLKTAIQELKRLERLKSVQIPDCEWINKAQQSIRKKKESNYRLSQLIRKAKYERDQQCQLDQEINRLTASMDSLGIKTCPACGQNVRRA